MSDNQQITTEEIIRQEKLKYFREWRANNKDKVKKHNANYWKRRAEKRIKEESEAKGIE